MSEVAWELAVAGVPLDQQRATLKDELVRTGLPASASEWVMARALPGALLRVDRAASCASAAGGPASIEVPVDWAWPESQWGPLALLAVIRLDEIVGMAELSLAAIGGTLLFFHDETPGLDDMRLDATHVLHVPEGAPTRAVAPFGEYQMPAAVPLVGAAAPIPGHDDEVWTHLQADGQGDAWIDASGDALESHNESWKLLGRPFADTPISQLIRRWFQTPEAAADGSSFSQAERAGEGWTLLLQTRPVYDDDLAIDIMGSRFFVLPEVDLKRHRFDRVVAFVDPW